MKIKLVRPLRIVREGEEYKPSLIAFGTADNFERDGMVIGWDHVLYLNLWIIELYFTWKTGVNE